MTTEEVKGVDAQKSNVDEVPQPSIEDLQAQITTLTAEAAKYRNQRTKAQQERDELKKTSKEAAGDDYKALWTESEAKAERLLNKAKTASVDSSIRAKLTKAGVLPDAIDAAVKLVDHSMVEWSEDNGIDEVSANAAAAKLKSQYAFMFEKKVSSTEPKNAAEGKSTSDKTLTRSQFDSLTPALKTERMKAGWKLTD